MIEENIKIKVINRLYDIKKVVGLRVNGRFMCEFHNDYVASAKVYGNAVYCFACRRFYYVYNYLKKRHISIDKVWEELIMEYGSEENVLKEYEKISNEECICNREGCCSDNEDIMMKYEKYLEIYREVYSGRCKRCNDE